MGEKRGMKALELWCRRVTEGYPGVKIENMTTSWRDGLAFCALIHHFRPDLIDFDGLDKRDIYKNNELAFRVAERQLGIPALLDAEDMVEYEVPDRLSILTYLSQFYQAFVSNQQGSTNPSSRSHPPKVPDMISSSTKSQKTSKVSPGRLESCWSCRRPVFLAERLVVGGKLRHRTCFTCSRCGHQLSPIGYYETEDGDFVCEMCPNEEEQKQMSSHEEENLSLEDLKDDYSLNFEMVMESVDPSKRNNSKTKFLQDMMEGSQPDQNFLGIATKNDLGSDDVSFGKERSVKNVLPDSVNDNQYPTANRKNLNVKIKNLLGRDFNDTLSLLNKESDSFIVDISEIIDNIINDAVKKAEYRVEESLNCRLSFPLEGVEANADIKQTDKKTAITGRFNVSNETNQKEKAEKKRKTEEVKPEVVDDSKEVESYPEDLNPFADEQDDVEERPKSNILPITTRKTPLPSVKPRSAHFNQSGQKILEAPKINLNPFWSDGEPSSDEDITKPIPAPRTSLRAPEHSAFSRSKYGSFTSLSSIGSSASALRKKKGPAPLPPSVPKSPHSPFNPECISSSPLSPASSHRKSKPAPSPPSAKLSPSPPSAKPTENELISEKKEKNYENKMKQNFFALDKSSYGKWKRKKGQAPGLPIPQRRRITPLPMPEVYRELEDLEIQQRELERQGVTTEQAIREYEIANTKERGKEEEEGGKDVEELILQLFEIVNQKNELFRRQAELMLLLHREQCYRRRQQRLEEEHADVEYQIRCLMGRPERNKTDSDKAQEEELIRRLVQVVERRNEIIECLDMDRKREVEEDESIHHHLEVFAGKTRQSEEKSKSNLKNSSSLLKYIKKKKSKKEKTRESSVKIRRSEVKDMDQPSKDENAKINKPKKNWFSKA